MVQSTDELPMRNWPIHAMGNQSIDRPDVDGHNHSKQDRQLQRSGTARMDEWTTYTYVVGSRQTSASAAEIRTDAAAE